MRMKLFLSVCIFLFSTVKVKADLLDDLDHDDHHDHDDHLDNKEDIAKQLLIEIERFLPHEETPIFDAPSIEEPFDFGTSFEDISKDVPLSFIVSTGNTGLESLQGGVPLSLPVHSTAAVAETTPRGIPLSPLEDLDNTGGQSQIGVPLPSLLVDTIPTSVNTEPTGIPLSPLGGTVNTNQIPEIPELPQVPEIADNALPQQEPSFGLIPEDPIPNDLVSHVEFDAPDSRDEDLTLHVDIPGSLISSSLSLDSPPKDFEDVTSNFIGGQGRQLDEGQAPFAPNSFSPFDGDFPSYKVVPRTSFSCGDQQLGGYYADTEAECQVFHICLGGGLMGSFLCPIGTLFNQALFVCDWWYNVDCSLAPDYYHLNARIGVIDDSGEDFS